MRTALTLSIFALLSGNALAQDKPKPASDAVQGLSSPFQVGSGATFLVTQDKKSVTTSVSGQMTDGSSINVWQLGVTATTNDEGEGLIYATSDTAAPGLKAKLGFGHSSFLTAVGSPRARTVTADVRAFLGQTWCLDTLAEIAKTLPNGVARTSGMRCAEYLSVVASSLAANPPADKGNADIAKAVIDAFTPIAGDPAPKRQTVCAGFKDAAKSVYKFCPDSGAPQVSQADEQRHYPEIYSAMVLVEFPAFYYTVFANYQPTIASAAYRDVADLSKKNQWTQLLHGVSIDTTFYYKRLVAGVQLAYLETVDIKLASVCKVTTSGDYRAEQCKDATLGKPDPDQAYAVSGALALDPLILPSKTTIARPGAQLQFRYERPSRGSGYKTEVSLPFFLAPVEAPMKLVVGVRPTWNQDTTGDDTKPHFSVFFFIGARPGVGGN